MLSFTAAGGRITGREPHAGIIPFCPSTYGLSAARARVSRDAISGIMLSPKARRVTFLNAARSSLILNDRSSYCQ